MVEKIDSLPEIDKKMADVKEARLPVLKKIKDDAANSGVSTEAPVAQQQETKKDPMETLGNIYEKMNRGAQVAPAEKVRKINRKSQEKKAFSEVKKKMQSEFEQFMSNSPELEGKVDQGKFFEYIINKMPRKNTNNAGNDEENYKNFLAARNEKEDSAKLADRFKEVAEKTKNIVIKNANDANSKRLIELLKPKPEKSADVSAPAPEAVEQAPVSEAAPEAAPEKTPEQLEAEAKAKEAEAKRKENIEQVKIDLENVRNDYARIDYEKRKAWGGMNNFLKKEDIQEKIAQDKEISDMREIYKSKLKDYKEALILDMKESGLSGEELNTKLGEIMDILLNEDKTLFDTQMKIREEENKGENSGLWGKIKNQFEESVKEYKSYSWKKKLVFSAAVLAGGVGATVLGFTAAAVGLAAVGLSARLIGAASLGYGAATASKGFLEKKADKERINKNEWKKSDEFSKNKKETEETRIANIDKFLDDKIADVDKQFLEMKKKSKNITAKSVGIGIAASVAALSVGKVLEATGISDKINGLIQRAGHAVVHTVAPDLFPDMPNHSAAGVSPKNLVNNGGVPPGGTYPAEHVASVPVAESVTIKEGGNFWAAIENKIDSVEPGVDHAEATRTAWKDGIAEYATKHKISFDAAVNKLSGIHPGTEFNMTHDATGWHAHFDDDNIKFMHGAEHHSVGGGHHGVGHDGAGTVAPSETHQSGSAVEHPQDLAGKTQAEIDELRKHAEELQREVAAEDARNKQLHVYNEKAGDMDTLERVKSDKNLSELKAAADDAQSELNKLLNKTGVSLDSTNTRVNAISLKNTLFGNGKVFEEVRNMKVSDVMDSKEAKADFMKKLTPDRREYLEKIMKMVPPRSENSLQVGDTFRRWIARVAIEAKK